MDELLGTDFAVAEKDRLYRCLDRVLEHKQELFRVAAAEVGGSVPSRFRSAALRPDQHVLRRRDGTEPQSQARLQSRWTAGLFAVGDCAGDHARWLPVGLRSDGRQHSDRATLRGFLDKIEKTYGKAKRMWVMDRGIPSEAILQEMRDPARQMFYLVGTPKGKIQSA